MAIVVALADRRPQAPTPRPKDKEPLKAQILLFTGVRYERIVDVPKRPPQRASIVENE